MNPSLNAPCAEERLAALRATPIPDIPLSDVYVNNHIHTVYSFSPYAPSAAIYQARAAGLPTAGIIDHDAIAGAEEFRDAGACYGVGTTTGLECRVSMADTPFAGARINNPDQAGNAYIAMHGIPRPRWSAVDAVFAPLRRARGLRNAAMTARLNAILAPCDIALDYEKDIVPLSQQAHGGSVTERHICYAASLRFARRYGRAGVLPALQKLGIEPPARVAGWLADTENPSFDYDLLGLLKSQLVPRFYLPAAEECLPIKTFVELARDIGAIAAYPYLGDVGDSVTGDKAVQRFEDAFLAELFDMLAACRVQAITYMPSRNTERQLARVRALCIRMGFFEISGEDINAPRQSFICPALARPEFAHLRAAAWALIGHEKMASEGDGGLFSAGALRVHPLLSDRVATFAAIGKRAVPE